MKIVVEHNIKDIADDIAKIIEIQHDFFVMDEGRLELYFSEKCTHLDPAVAVIVGAMPIVAKGKDKVVVYRFLDEVNHPVLAFMKKVGIYKHYTYKEEGFTGDNVIPFGTISNEDVMETYTDLIIKHAPIAMTKLASDTLSSYFYEIYQNSIFHSGSPHGAFSSGMWSPEKKKLSFSIYDAGIGIIENIRQHEQKELAEERCLDLAFCSGYTTRRDYVCRGLGLHQLENFIRLNRGMLSMYTNNMECIIDDEHEERRYRKLEKSIIGTLIIINIKADENHEYKLKSE